MLQIICYRDHNKFIRVLNLEGNPRHSVILFLIHRVFMIELFLKLIFMRKSAFFLLLRTYCINFRILLTKIEGLQRDLGISVNNWSTTLNAAIDNTPSHEVN